MKQIGSQRRETLDEAGYNLIRRNDGFVLLENKGTGILELWSRQDDFAGYVVEIAGLAYEFVSERKS